MPLSLVFYETLITKMEEKATNALEMAEKTPKKRKKEA